MILGPEGCGLFQIVFQGTVISPTTFNKKVKKLTLVREQCGKCQKKFWSMEELGKHIRIFCLAPMYDIKCTKCEKLFDPASNVFGHLMSCFSPL